MGPIFERTLQEIEELYIIRNEKGCACKIRILKASSIPLELLLLLQSIILLPFQIVGKALSYLLVKVFPNSTCVKKFQELCSEELWKTIVKVICLPIGLLLTASLGLFSSHTNFIWQGKMWLVGEIHPHESVTNWYCFRSQTDKLQRQIAEYPKGPLNPDKQKVKTDLEVQLAHDIQKLDEYKNITRMRLLNSTGIKE